MFLTPEDVKQLTGMVRALRDDRRRHIKNRKEYYMNCPICRSDNGEVLRTEDNGAVISRRRKCKACGHRYDTSEVDSLEIQKLKALRETLRTVFEGVMI